MDCKKWPGETANNRGLIAGNELKELQTCPVQAHGLEKKKKTGSHVFYSG